MALSVEQAVAGRPGNLAGFPGAVWLLLAGDLITAAAVGLTQPYLVVFLHETRGVPLAVATGLVALAAVASLVGNPVAGALIDRWGGRPVMLAGLAVAAAGMLTLAGASGSAAAGLGVAVTGLGWSVSMPALSTRLATLTVPALHPRVYTLQYALFNVGLAGGAAAGGLVIARVAPASGQGRAVLPWLWIGAAVLCLAGMVLAAAAGRQAPPARPAGTPSGGYRQALADRRLLPVLGAATLLSTVGYGIYNAAPPVLAVAAHDAAALSWLTIANAVTVVAGAPVALRYAERLRPRTALLWTALLWALAWLVCVPAVAGAGFGLRTALVCAAVLTGAGELLIAGALPSLVNAVAPEELRGRYNALSSWSLTAGMMAGPLLTSAATASDATLALLCAAAGLAGAAGLLLLLTRRSGTS
ncbi:MFS transporter [Actinoplanes missouriensis]|uniref:MFS transporter n=1 Tax=Actinoplanes missouriensis TaxID=1866 RepID=UPI0033CF5601